MACDFGAVYKCHDLLTYLLMAWGNGATGLGVGRAIKISRVRLQDWPGQELHVSWSRLCAPSSNYFLPANGELLDTAKARKLAYYGHTMRKRGSCLEKEVMQGKMPGARRRGRPSTAWMDNINTWTKLSVEESIRMTEDRDKWSKYVYGASGIENGKETEQNTIRRSCAAGDVTVGLSSH